MSFVRLRCPRCHEAFDAGADQLSGQLVCPHCRWRLALNPNFFNSLAWYFARDCNMEGPFSWSQLREMAAGGQIRATDLIWRRGALGWSLADSFVGLFAAAEAKTINPPAEAPLRVADETDEDIFADAGDSAAADEQGPFSQKGIKVHPRRSLTLGDFQILKKVGSGAMGAVYLAYQRSHQRKVALKVLSRHLAVQPQYVQRFFREAAVLANLDHPNIVGYYGSGQEKDFPYFAMEFVDGFSTMRLLRYFGGRLPVPDALHIVTTCAEALAYAHQQHIVHRDVKPDNIMITHQGQVKIADLGLAKLLHEDLDITESGAGMGTPRYMAPEQARNAKHADQRCDIYALGGVLYHFVTGIPPFHGESAMELLLAKDQGLFRSARGLNVEVPPRLDLIIDKMLARDVKYRYQTCVELLRDLHTLALPREHLSFNPLHVLQTPINNQPIAYDRVEILLIHDNPSDILLAQEALEESGVPSNLNVVNDGLEALSFLRRHGKHAAAPRPNLIILGRNLRVPGSWEVIEEIKNREELRTIPLVVLTDSHQSVEQLQKDGLQVSLTVTRPDDLKEFENLIKSVHGLCLTVVERLPRM